MKATFYLHEDTLACSKEIDKQEYVKRLGDLLKDISYIVDDKTDENDIRISEGIYTAQIFDGIGFVDFAVSELDRDEQTAFFKILYDSDKCESFKVEDIEPLTHHQRGESECHALMVLNQKPATDKLESDDSDLRIPFMQFSKYEIVYDRTSWLTVRRQILGNHPGMPYEFIDKCKHYFENLDFGLDCVDTLEDHLLFVPRKIVYYLACMNDCLLDFWKKHTNKNSPKIYCADFAGRCKMDKAGSPQGSKKEKAEEYSFRFKDGLKLKCGAHFKITHIDDNCNDAEAQKSEKFHSRIYFAIYKDKIHVGSIGRHV